MSRSANGKTGKCGTDGGNGNWERELTSSHLRNFSPTINSLGTDTCFNWRTWTPGFESAIVYHSKKETNDVPDKGEECTRRKLIKSWFLEITTSPRQSAAVRRASHDALKWEKLPQTQHVLLLTTASFGQFLITTRTTWSTARARH